MVFYAKMTQIIDTFLSEAELRITFIKLINILTKIN